MSFWATMDDSNEQWRRDHEELYGRIVPNPQLDKLEDDAKREEEAETLIKDVKALEQFYRDLNLPKWKPGDEPWLE